ncbi:MAG: redoxin domain-containing protein [Dehalococcoidia bacterium]|jgi:hypothetical protein|nr:redoxin domain-containing protein [Dehalococcoidia bacterium]
MTTFTIIDDGTPAEVQATVEDGRIRVAPVEVECALQWELKPEGFCLGPVCYPLPPDSDVATDAGIDIAALAELIGRPAAIDTAEGAAYLGVPARERAQPLAFLSAPDFTLPDLAGTPHSLSDYRGKKVLLAAYASW